MATDQPLQTNWETRLLISWIASTETEISFHREGSERHPLLEPFPGALPADKGSI